MPTSQPVTSALRCIVCCVPFDFAAGETAVVLRHVAYGCDFVHDGPCLGAACDGSSLSRATIAPRSVATPSAAA
jgi:hypothetical protein